MVYNAFPHFPESKGLIDHLAELMYSLAADSALRME